MAEALLVLEDGRCFRGEAYGALGETFGEAVFSTGMTGYQETLTDPSYHRQVVVMTAPHVGNTGVNAEDAESPRIWVAGYVVRDPARIASSWRSQRSLEDALREQGVVGISGIDTRALTRHLRDRGAMRVGISTSESDSGRLLQRVRSAPAMSGSALAAEVSTPAAYTVPAVGERRFVVAALDLGIKTMTPKLLSERGVEVTVLPATSSLDDVLAVEPDGVFFSNGPGDPATADHEVALLREVLRRRIAYFGICFGNQLFGRALGFDTYKLRYGHRGINQPVVDRSTGRVEVTAHNHGFAVGLPGREDGQSAVGVPGGEVGQSAVGVPGREVGQSAVGVPGREVGQSAVGVPGREDGQSAVGVPGPSSVGARSDEQPTGAGPESEPYARVTPYGRAEVSHVCLNDGVIEGLRLLDDDGRVTAFSVQYHPEAAAGPHDAGYLFDRFVELMSHGSPAARHAARTGPLLASRRGGG